MKEIIKFKNMSYYPIDEPTKIPLTTSIEFSNIKMKITILAFVPNILAPG